jgi:antitoxin MazE
VQVQVQKWGNSLALRIPKAFALEAGIDEHASVDLTIQDGKLVIGRVVSPPLDLDTLLAGVTDENLHGEIDTGLSVGREEW